VIDLLVAGGGPAGLATAIHAARAGLDVLVAEPRPAPVDKACGEGLMPAGVRELAALGVTVEGRPFRGIRYLDGRVEAEAHFRDGQGLGLRRTTLHHALARRAAELGVPVLPLRVDPRTLRHDHHHVTAAGITARYLAAADGLHSPIRRSLGLDLPPTGGATRYGLRRHFAVAPWTDCVEVHWAARSEAYVTPIGPKLVGVAILTTDRAPYEQQLARFPELATRLPPSAATPTRGAGPLHQRARSPIAGRTLLVGDAAGYIDAITGEGISTALAAAAHLVRCLEADRPQDYSRAWHRASRRQRALTTALLWTRTRPALAPRIVPTAARFPTLFTTAINQLA
jgi:flavin-dependent dehydrogenase